MSRKSASDALHQLNDSLYELHKPDRPSLQILFFHGLQAHDYVNAHLTTWQSGNGSCIWPETWLVEKYRNAHVLTVSYSGGLRRGGIGMHAIAENLISDLLRENIGQTGNCPVILVGHCFGGLVIKQLCVEAFITYNLLQKVDRERPKLKRFLKSIKGIYYYGTPHHGSPSLNKMSRHSLSLKFRPLLDSPLLTYFKTLSTETEWLNFRFQRFRGLYCIRIHGLGETLKARKDLFRGVVGVPEPSARDGDVFNLVVADHIGICRPAAKNTRSFYGLTDLIDLVLDDLTRETRVGEEVCKQPEEKWALGVSPPQNFPHHLSHVVPKWQIHAQISRPREETSRNLDAPTGISGSIVTGSKASDSLYQRHVIAEDHAQIYGSVCQLNDSLYELHKPAGIASMQIIFFHGLQPGDYADAHLSTWKSGDGSCIWIKTWLIERYPSAQILSVSYSGGNVLGSYDTEVLAGKLIADLMQQDIGKDPDCPVILVGHCFGGLVIKHLCLLAASLHSATVSGSQRAKLRSFLASMRGIFYYSDPQLGVPLMTTVADERLGWPCLRYFKSLSTEAEWLDAQFSQLQRKNPQWLIYSLYPSNSELRDFYPSKARNTNCRFNVAEHLRICQPMNKIDKRFYALQFLLDLMGEPGTSREPRLNEEFGTPEDDNS